MPVTPTITLAESGVIEEAGNELIQDAAFVPSPPLGSSVIPTWLVGTTYGAGALVQEAGVVYRSLAAGNVGHEPKADADYVNWAPNMMSSLPLQNPDFLHVARSREQIVGVSTSPGQAVSPYESGKAYAKGEYATEAGIGYEAIKATTGETPSTTPASWKPLGPAIGLGQ